MRYFDFCGILFVNLKKIIVQCNARGLMHARPGKEISHPLIQSISSAVSAECWFPQPCKQVTFLIITMQTVMTIDQ